MKKQLSFHSLLLTSLLLISCGGNAANNDSTVEFRSPKGDIVAIRTIQGNDTTWTFNNALGEALVPGTDSLWVVADTANGQPKEVIFFHKGQQTMLTFWDNMERMTEGDLVDGLRHGRWTGYERNTGRKQSETNYSIGVENGSYIVYNYNGTPRIEGQYTDGKPTGEWTFYDQDGNLAGTKKYDN
jgi:hypothetical protein